MANLRVANRIFLQKSSSSFRCFSEKAAPKTPHYREKLLLQKLSPLVHQNAQLTDIDKVITDYRKTFEPRRFDLFVSVKHFRSLQDFHLALQLIRWMETNNLGVKDSDRAIEIDLLFKTEGIESAEKHFDKLQQSEKTDKTYGSLLSCFCKKKKLDKALELFEKMKELGCASTSTYNNLSNLYMTIGQPQMVASLVEEMEQTNVSPNIYTYSILMNSYAALKDLDAMENVLMMMKAKEINLDWIIYGNVAKIYVASGLRDKACTIVKEMENRKESYNEEAFQILIDIHADLKNLTSIYITWESLKSSFPTPSNKSYLIMLLALLKVGESESLEKYFKEWEAGCSNYDVRVSTVMLESYLNRDMIEEANLLIERVQQRGRDLNLKGCELLSNFHIKRGEIDLALKYLDMAAKIAVSENRKWYPTDETIKAFSDYFEKSNDTENAEIFVECMKQTDRLDSAAFKSLVGSPVTSTLTAT